MSISYWLPEGKPSSIPGFTYPLFGISMQRSLIGFPIISQRRFSFLDKCAPVVIADPGVASDAQQGQSHLVRDTVANGTEGTIAIWKVTGVFPEEVADEGFSFIFIARMLQEKVLQFPGNTPDIKNTVRTLHVLQVDGKHFESTAKEEVGGS